MINFTSGLELSRQYFSQIVKPILGKHFPNLRYDAALVGKGSEVQGFDDHTSTDHDWGPSLKLFISDLSHAEAIDHLLETELPTTFMGFPTRLNFTTKGFHAKGSQHLVTIETVPEFLKHTLGCELPLRPIDWVTFGGQALREVTKGAVFHDGLQELNSARNALKTYPHDVWLYLMAGTWRRIGQDEHLMGRAGSKGDELGSSILGARLVRDIMRLAFYMEQEYIPYPKWFGTAFAKLELASKLSDPLQKVLHALTWQKRQKYLVHAYEILADKHNALGVASPQPTKATCFHDRPFRVIHGDRFSNGLLNAITDPEVKALPKTLGGIDEVSDSTDILHYPDTRKRAQAIWSQG